MPKMPNPPKKTNPPKKKIHPHTIIGTRTRYGGVVLR